MKPLMIALIAPSLNQAEMELRSLYRHNKSQITAVPPPYLYLKDGTIIRALSVQDTIRLKAYSYDQVFMTEDIILDKSMFDLLMNATRKSCVPEEFRIVVLEEHD